MNFSIAFNYFKRIWRELSQLSEQTGYSRFYHLCDYLSAFVRHGAHIRQYIIGEFWRLSNAERSRRLTFYRMMRLEKKYNNRQYTHYLNSKKDFNEYFSEFIRRGWMCVKGATYSDFKGFLDKYTSIIIKPLNDKQGNGIRKFTYSGQDEAELHQLFDELSAQDALIEECLSQHPDMVFGNTCLNTIRAMSLCGPDGKGHVMKAILRAGVGDTVVDNYARGGSIYEVDLKTGVVTSYGKSKAGDVHLVHPKTDIVMLGYKIPMWNQVIEICERASEKLPQVAFVGWDVAITQDSVQLIEGNCSADYELYEYLGNTGFYEKIKAILNPK